MTKEAEQLWTWAGEQFSAKLFAAAGIVIAQSEAEDDYVALEVRGLCGAIKVQASSVWVQQACEATPEALIALITDTWWSREYLEDVDFGRFRKSEIFHALICDLILPTQITTGLLWTGSVASGKMQVDTEALELSHIRHTGLKGERRIDYVRGAIPVCDEFSLWGNGELAAISCLDGLPLSIVLNVIYEQIIKMMEDVEWIKCTCVPNNPDGIKRPTTYTELIKYHRYAGIPAMSVWSEAEGE